jgi:large subunit ribosomal protein L29
MAILRSREIRKLEKPEAEKKLKELRLELAKERANIAIGAAASSPGKVRELRKTIARLETARKARKPAAAAGGAHG